MITFNDKIELNNDVAHWYIDHAEDYETNVFDLFEIVLTEYYLRRNENEA